MPAALSILVVGTVIVLEINVPVTGDNGILRAAVSLFTVAGGFFIAALTVLITNDHKVLNAYFIGDHKPSIKGETEQLTRKRFLALLFGYLSFMSFSTVAICLLIIIYSDFFVSVPKTLGREIAAYLGGFFGSFTAFQIFLLSMVGLHYLTDRLHRSDGRSKFRVTPPKL